MLNDVKALIVILVLASLVFIVAKPICVKYMAEEDFIRRRNVWLGLTVCAFLSPNFWLYAAIATPLAFWAGRKDPNPAAVYAVLLFAAPAAGAFIPKLIAMSHQVILCLAVAMPALLASRRQAGAARPPGVPGGHLPAFLLFTFCTIQALLFLRYESVTNVARREVSLLLGIFVPFLLFSRTLRDRKAIAEALACFVLAGAIMAPLAMFESMRGWQLYVEKASSWGASVNPFAYLMRAGQLRALVATDHSLILGYVFALCFGFSLYLQGAMQSTKMRLAMAALIWIGLFSSYSRGAWFAAILMMLVYFWLLPGGTRRVFKVLSLIAIAALVLSPTPFAQRIFDSLPFIGTIDTGNADYRQRLFERSLDMIPLHPWFGDLLVRSKMPDMIQGQGIVDLVNGFLQVAMLYGLVTLGVILLFLAVILRRTLVMARRHRAQPEDASLGLNLVACLLGSLLFVWTATWANQIWVLAGLCTAYAYRSGSPQWATSRAGRSLGPAVQGRPA